MKITLTRPIIKVICPKKYQTAAECGINMVKSTAKSNLAYKIVEQPNTDIIVSLREQGLATFIKDLFQKKDKLETRIPHEEFEHGITTQVAIAFEKLNSLLQNNKMNFKI